MLRHGLTLALGLALAAPALALNPYAAPDDSRIAITGTVAEPTEESFVLEYAGGEVLVEMDAWEWQRYDEAYGLLEGDKVTVHGIVDDDLYETAKIEASSVYVASLNTYFFASPRDEEDATVWLTDVPVVVGTVVVRGTVSGTDPASAEFTVDTEAQKLTVDASTLGYNPLDARGFQQIEKGDLVSVSGMMDEGFLKDRVLRATSVVTLSDTGPQAAGGGTPAPSPSATRDSRGRPGWPRPPGSSRAAPRPAGQPAQARKNNGPMVRPRSSDWRSTSVSIPTDCTALPAEVRRPTKTRPGGTMISKGRLPWE